MNPFTKPQSNPAALARSLFRPAPLLFIVCLLLGGGAVAWRTIGRMRTVDATTRIEARAYGALLEAQLNQAATAAEVLGAVASQGKLANFQKLGSDLLKTHPGLASLELQPGGIVSDIVPKASNERAVGVNVLKDPSQSPGANQALARRALTVSGPVKLYRGEAGFIARVPIFQRAADGRESFWGFVAASVRLQETLTRTQVELLPRKGYNYALLGPGTGQQRGITIVTEGLTSLRDTVQQPVHVQNLDLQLLLKPRGGWLDKTKLALDCLAVLLFSSLAALLALALNSRSAVEAELAEANQRLAHEQENRTQTDANHAATRDRLQAELKRAQLGLEQANARATQFETNARENHEALQLEQAKVQAAQAALAQAQQTAAQLETQLQNASQAEKKTAAAADERVQHHQTALVELRTKLEAATRNAREAAKANAVELAQAQQANRELAARLAQAEQAQAQVAELEGLLQAAQQQLQERAAPAAEEVPASEAPRKPRRRRAPDEEADTSEPSAPLPAPEPESRAEEVSPEREPDEAAESQPAEADAAPEPAGVAADPPSDPVATDPPVDEPQAESEPVESAAAAHEPAEASGPAETPASPKAAGKPSKRKKSRDDQMDLFGGDASPAKVAADKPAVRLPPAPPVNPAQLRQAVHQILPLLVDQDPGAKDCLRDNRNTFRSAFTPEAFVDFEQLVKKGDYGAALEDLKRAARKHSIVV